MSHPDFEDLLQYPIRLASVPSGWCVTTAEAVCLIIEPGFASGEHNSDGAGIPHIRPMNISRDGRLDLSVVKFIDPSRDSRRLRRGDVLFNNTNSPILVGKTCAIEADATLAFSNHMTRLRPAAGIEASFLANQLHYVWMSGFFLHRCVKHVNQASIASGVLADRIPILIAPTDEQKRIVSAIESLLSKVDAAVATLERVRANLKRYRASVLKAAVEGKLVPTEAELARKEGRDYEPASVLLGRILAERRRLWEESELVRMKAAGKPPKDDRWKSKYKEPVAPDTTGLPLPPDGWCWATVDQIASDVRYGTSAKTHDESSGFPVLRMGNIVDGGLDFTTLKYLPEDHSEFPELLLANGDLLFNRTNSAELVGKTAIFKDRAVPFSFASYLIRVRLLSGCSPDYVSSFLNSFHGRRWIGSVVSQVVGQANVNGSKLKNCPIPLPPQAEQRRIVSEVDRLSSVIQSNAVACDLAIVRSQRLRQSILKWAFEGKLVDQDPNDESASVLLERIRAERAASTPLKKSRQPNHRESHLE